MHRMQFLLGALAASLIGINCDATTLQTAPEMGFFKKKKKPEQKPDSEYKKLVGSDSVNVKGVMNVVKKDQDF